MLLKYVFYGLISNMTALVEIMAWHRTGDKPLSEAMLVCCTDANMRHSTPMLPWHWGNQILELVT